MKMFLFCWQEFTTRESTNLIYYINNTAENSHDHFNKDKSFDKFNTHSWFFKNLSKLGLKWNFLNLLIYRYKKIYKLFETFNSNHEILNTFLLKLEMRQEFLLSQHLLNIMLEILQCNYAITKTEIFKIWKRKYKGHKLTYRLP